MKNKSKLTILLISILLLTSSCSSSKWLPGNWEGIGNQIDGHTWQVDLNYLSKTNISIDYPDLSCGGVWTILQDTKKELIFKEQIEYGTWKCDQGNEVYVSKIDKNSIKVLYYLRSYDAINPIAEAILTRVNK